MITIKKHGIHVQEATCDVCGCEFFYTHEDTKTEYHKNEFGCPRDPNYEYVMCPECMAHRIIVCRYPQKKNEH